MKWVIDMNLSPSWTDIFTKFGLEAVHWSKVGPADASDSEIMAWAEQHGCGVFTHDLDFGTLLRLTTAKGPSVVQIRAEDIRPATMGSVVCAAVTQAEAELRQGALLTIDPRRHRITLLPLGRPS